MTPTTKGYVYWVSDEQLHTFARLSPERRFAWAEETRAFLVAAPTPTKDDAQRQVPRTPMPS